MAAILIDDHFAHLGQEGLLEADEFAVAGRPAQDHAQNIVAALVPGHDPITNEERHRAAVIRNDPVAHQVLCPVRVRVAQELLDAIHDGGEGVGVVIVVLALQDAGQAFQARACVHTRLRQRNQFAALLLFVLHEDQIPDLQVLIVYVDAGGGLFVQVAPVIVDLGAGTAGADVSHGPPVVLFAKAEDPLWRRAHSFPQLLGLVVLGVDGEPETLDGQA